MPDSTVRRWLADLVELEYLRGRGGSKGGQGKTARYRLAERRPRDSRSWASPARRSSARL